MEDETGNEMGLVEVSRLRQALAQTDDLDVLKEWRDQAETIRHYVKQRGGDYQKQNDAAEAKVRIERKLGEVLAGMAMHVGGRPETTGDMMSPVKDEPTLAGMSMNTGELYRGNMMLPRGNESTLADIGISKMQSSRWQLGAELDEDVFEGYLAKQWGDGNEITSADILRLARRQEAVDKLDEIATLPTESLNGIYDVIVIDPPWPMKKIEREVAPAQVEFDYPTMTESELLEWGSETLLPACADDCHVWMWTTHKHLPMALRLLDKWALKYICTFVWHKPGGFQPFNLPQYNCEFVLYAHKGNPQFIDTKQFNTCFSAPRQGHSVKPEEFYDVVRRVTGGRRVDMFGRRVIEGFDSWGQEVQC